MNAISTYIYEGVWKHKLTGQELYYTFDVICLDLTENPLEVINQTYDMGGLTFIQGKAKKIDIPKSFAILSGTSNNQPIPIHKE